MAKKKKQQEPPMEPLRAWIQDRLSRGDIRYVHRIDGRDVFQVLRNPYPEDENDQITEEKE